MVNKTDTCNFVCNCSCSRIFRQRKFYHWISAVCGRDDCNQHDCVWRDGSWLSVFIDTADQKKNLCKRKVSALCRRSSGSLWNSSLPVSGVKSGAWYTGCCGRRYADSRSDFANHSFDQFFHDSGAILLNFYIYPLLQLFVPLMLLYNSSSSPLLWKNLFCLSF